MMKNEDIKKGKCWERENVRTKGKDEEGWEERSRVDFCFVLHTNIEFTLWR